MADDETFLGGERGLKQTETNRVIENSLYISKNTTPNHNR